MVNAKPETKTEMNLIVTQLSLKSFLQSVQYRLLFFSCLFVEIAGYKH